LRHAELRHHPPDVVAGEEHVEVELVGDLGDAVRVGERGHRFAPGTQGSLDDEVAFGEEHPGSGVVTSLRPIGEAALAEPEAGETRIVGAGHRDEPGSHRMVGSQ
jgi:hypothetical protein